MKMTAEMSDRINLFVDNLQALYNAHFAEKFPTLVADRIALDPNGVKYARIVCHRRYRDNNGDIQEQSGGYAYCFIDVKNGDILKSAGWKAPAKGARGNIFNDNCDVGTRADVSGSGLYIR